MFLVNEGLSVHVIWNLVFLAECDQVESTKVAAKAPWYLLTTSCGGQSVSDTRLFVLALNSTRAIGVAPA